MFQSGWSIDVEIVIGPDVGISYLTGKTSSVSCCREFYLKGFIVIIDKMHLLLGVGMGGLVAYLQ